MGDARQYFRNGDNLVRPLNVLDVGVTLHDGSLEVGLCLFVVNNALEVVAEGVLDQLHAALVVGGQRRDLDALGNGSEVNEGVLTAQELGSEGVILGSLLHAGLGVGEVGVILGDLQQVILVGGDSQDDFLDVLGVVGAYAAMDIGAAPVIFHRGIGDSPSTHVAIPVGTQHEVNAPGGEQEGEDTGGVRNFWVRVRDAGVFSALGASDMQQARKFTPEEEPVTLSAGFMWHSVRRTVKDYGVESTVTTFIPWDSNVEIMAVTLRNASDGVKTLTPCAAVPIYGRSADNLRDHRHVTSLLHRIQVTEEGVLVKPTMSFDERGHQKNERIYYVLGASGDGVKPVEFFPTVEGFIGEGGSLTHPRSVLEGKAGVSAGTQEAGKEAMGAFTFKPVAVPPGEEVHYIVLLGAEDDSEAIRAVYNQYNTWCKVCASLEDTKQHWQQKVNVSFETGSRDFDNLMSWVCFQPLLRRLFGCSFLPYHDYGRGGRGWRDLWQDCLSLLIMDPQGVGEMIEKNFGGVRMDGTNATIIGDGDGNFIADRNGIARVWMDHALWPLMTTKLYIDQTGDLEILLKKAPYFKDRLAFRGTGPDEQWVSSQGSQQRTAAGDIYEGTILEHLLIENLTAFYEVGDHNIYRLRGADWNDALDMAAEKGESVAFTCAYAGNLRTLAQLLLKLEVRGYAVSLPVELLPLMGGEDTLFEDKDGKQALLDAYCQKCLHTISGEMANLSPRVIAEDLLRKADWLTDFVREQEWIDGLDGEGWFNSYYDNHGQKVEGYFPDHVRMMLTGQVFSIMGGVATDDQIRTMTETVDKYLYDPKIGGYRLNTDFHELKMDMGRMFGFAYGEKENGAVFCHMAVMYANALYRRGFANEGWKVLDALAHTALDFETSRMYPGIPEYFRGDGRGMYPYLTGAASWYMLTMVTEVFGVSGEYGDLRIQPRLLASQFGADGKACITLPFAGKLLHISFVNLTRHEYGSYGIFAVSCGNNAVAVTDGKSVVIPRAMLELSDEDEVSIILHIK